MSKDKTSLTPDQMFEQRLLAQRALWEEVIDTYAGRFVLFQILAMGDIYNLNGEMPTDAVQHNRAEGRRAMALDVLKQSLSIHPEAYILMQKEAGAFAEKYDVPLDNQEEEGEQDA